VTLDKKGKSPTSVLSVEMDDWLKPGHAVEPESEMQLAAIADGRLLAMRAHKAALVAVRDVRRRFARRDGGCCGDVSCCCGKTPLPSRDPSNAPSAHAPTILSWFGSCAAWPPPPLARIFRHHPMPTGPHARAARSTPLATYRLSWDAAAAVQILLPSRCRSEANVEAGRVLTRARKHRAAGRERT
jgi:hypothetical protein